VHAGTGRSQEAEDRPQPVLMSKETVTIKAACAGMPSIIVPGSSSIGVNAKSFCDAWFLWCVAFVMRCNRRVDGNAERCRRGGGLLNRCLWRHVC